MKGSGKITNFIVSQATQYAINKIRQEFRKKGAKGIWNDLTKISPTQLPAKRVKMDSTSPRAVKNWKRLALRMKTGKKKYSWQTRGSYKGKFKKVNKTSGRGLADYNRKGIVNVVEQTGSFTDPDCLYILNDSVPGRMLLEVIIMALLRKLFEMCKIPIQGVQEYLESPTSGGLGVGNLQVRLTKFNYGTGVSSLNYYNLTNSSNLLEVANSFYGDFLWFCSGDNWNQNASQEDLVSFILCETDSADNVTNVRGELKLDQVEIEIYGKSSLKVQNRTRAANGSTDAEDVNNNPLQGRSYLFKGLPKFKGMNKPNGVEANTLFETVDVEKGIRHFPANIVDFKEPPPPTSFWNCIGSSKIRLEPGDIKKFDVVETKKMFVKRLLQKMRMQNASPLTGGGHISYTIFKSQLIALEDVINVNLEEPIGVAFEVERTLAAKCSTKSNSFCRTYYEQEAL